MEAIKSEILSHGLDDWVHIGEVVEIVREEGYRMNLANEVSARGECAFSERGDQLIQAEREALPLGIAAIKELIREGLARVGDVTESGFVPWNGSREEIEDRIDQAVRDVQYPLFPGDILWAENTPSGIAIARMHARMKSRGSGSNPSN